MIGQYAASQQASAIQPQPSPRLEHLNNRIQRSLADMSDVILRLQVVAVRNLGNVPEGVDKAGNEPPASSSLGALESALGAFDVLNTRLRAVTDRLDCAL